MSSQAEEHRTSGPESDGGAENALHTRVSELLDNATETPDDDVLREELLRSEPASDDMDVTATSSLTTSVDTENREQTGVRASSEARSSTVFQDQAPTSKGEEPAEPDDIGQAPASVESSPAAELVSSDVEGGDADESTVDAPSDAASTEPAQLADAEKDGDDIAPSTVRIRGRPGGVLVEIDDEGEWAEILRLLEKRLDAAEGFFRGGKAVVEVGGRDVYEDELRQSRDLLARHDMTLAVVRSTSDLTLQSSLLLGLSTSSQTEQPVESDRDMAPVVPITQPTSPYFVHNGTLRSGQVLRKAESIMIVGDVNPGAKVISGGDVMVWGRLRGMAYAGATGNKGALVAAIEFSPTQLRIATVTAVPPDPPKSRGLRFWKKSEPEKRPEVAHIAKGRIVVEPWDDSRPGRPRVGRR